VTFAGPAVLFLAGLYQFTPLKDRCLDACRSPMSFVAEHWRAGPGVGGSAGAAAVRLGFHHGLFCLGCCWTLMGLMVVVGGANLGWMLLLGAVMAIEKAAPWGRRLVAPVGVALMAAAAIVSVRLIG
jgi:predicted metal-binding membrane protein